jgi:acyl-CoA thioesterase-1
VGANDFQGAFTADQRNACPASGCYATIAQHLKLSMIDILQTITKIHASPVSIVVLDYWDVVEDGAVAARDYGPQGEAKSQNATSYANAALHAAAQATRGGFVSTRVAFRGPDNDQDPTPLLAADGDHPNASGHAGIARALSNNRPHG